MAWKNSAGVKLNDATELIIRADVNGTVESCFNLSNNTEYVYTIPVSVVKINNLTASTRGITYTKASAYSVEQDRLNIPANDTVTINMAQKTGIIVGGLTKFTIVSGTVTLVNQQNAVVNSAEAELNIEDQ